MLEGYPPLVQSIMGTAFTWGMTAAGSSLVFLLQGQGGKVKPKGHESIFLVYPMSVYTQPWYIRLETLYKYSILLLGPEEDT